jgi:hypothetical protein
VFEVHIHCVLRDEQKVAEDGKQTTAKLLDRKVVTRVDQGCEKLKAGSRRISGWSRAGTLRNRIVMLNTVTVTVTVKHNNETVNYLKNVQLIFLI